MARRDASKTILLVRAGWQVPFYRSLKRPNLILVVILLCRWSPFLASERILNWRQLTGRGQDTVSGVDCKTLILRMYAYEVNRLLHDLGTPSKSNQVRTLAAHLRPAAWLAGNDRYNFHYCLESSVPENALSKQPLLNSLFKTRRYIMSLTIKTVSNMIKSEYIDRRSYEWPLPHL